MQKVMEYKRQITELKTEGKALFAKAETEKRSLTDAEEKRVGEINDKVDRLEAEETQYVRLNKIPLDQLRNMEPLKPEPEAKPTEERAAEKRTAFITFIRGGERALKHEQRALVEDASGLIYVPQDLETNITTGMAQINAMRRICGIRPTTRDKVEFPTMGGVAVGWGKLETGAAIVEGDPTPDKITVYAEDAQVLIKLGKDAMNDTEAALVAAIVEQASIALANSEAKMFAVGRGHTYNEPDGFTLNATIIASRTDLASADTAVPDDLLSLEDELPPQYANEGVYVMHQKTRGQIRKVKATTGPYLWQQNMVTGLPPTFNAYPVYLNNEMKYPISTSGALAIVAGFGNFRVGYKIVDRAGITIQRLDELYAEAGMVGFIIGKRVGGGTVLPDAIRALDNNT